MNMGIGSKPTKDEKARSCSLCSCLKTNKEPGDDVTPRLRSKIIRASVSELTVAVGEGCQNCGLVFDAIITWYGIQAMDPSSQFTFAFLPERLYIDPHEMGDTKYIEVAFSPQHPMMMDITSVNNIWKLPDARVLSGSTSSDSTFRHLAHLMRSCEELHENCSLTFANFLPKRILEIATGSVYLREPRKISDRYACLSHCWGPLGPVTRLTKTNLVSLNRGLATCQLPKIFQDAVVVCRSLGISYLWIDALCIIQDSPEDWEEAANTMADVYENACITIAAVSAADSTKGLFSPDRPARRLSKHPQFYVKAAFPSLYSHDGNLCLNTTLWPLLGRAWVYQERTLSPRIMYFSKEKVYWECKHGFASGEDRELKVWRHDSLGEWRDWAKDPTGSWQKMIQEYSGLQLTYEKDRLPAIAAVAHRMSLLRESGDVYLAGMWKNSITYDLCWFRFFPGPRPRPAGTIPSWSWASTQQSHIHFHERQQPCRVEVVSLTYNIVGKTFLGTVNDCKLVLRGYVLRLTETRGLSYKDILGINGKIPFESKTMYNVFRLLLQCHGLNLQLQNFFPDYDLETALPSWKEANLKIIIFPKIPNYIGGLVLWQLSESSDDHERIGFLINMIDQNYTSIAEMDYILQSVPMEDVLIV